MIPVSMSRRVLLGRSARLALAMAVGGCKASTSGPVPDRRFVPPPRARGSASIDVREHGARGDGRHDDTAAFQQAIDALPATGGTVRVPAGRYLIDPLRSVRPRSRTHLQLAPDAELLAKPNAAERAYVIYIHQVEDAEVSGGRIVGDRDHHLGEGGEWGHGIQVKAASRITIRDMDISSCWGDGICIGGEWAPGRQRRVLSEDVVIAAVRCNRNRRQGLSIGGSRNVRVHDSEFSATAGTAPQCGIDVEPDAPDSTIGVRIENCLMKGNASNGLQIYKRALEVDVVDCLIEFNGGYGILAIGAGDGRITGNRIRHNRLQGLGLRGGTRRYRVSGNHFRNNNVLRLNLNRGDPEWTAVDGRKGTRPHVDISDATDISLATNFFAD
jgi:hypothetical protein